MENNVIIWTIDDKWDFIDAVGALDYLWSQPSIYALNTIIDKIQKISE